MLVWFYNKKWVISQMGGFCMKKIIMAAGENSQTILLGILVIICIIIVLNMISFFYKKYKNSHFNKNDLTNQIFDEDQSQLYVLVRTKDFKVLFISSRFQEVFHIAKERIVVDFMVLKEMVEERVYRDFMKQYQSWNQVNSFKYSFKMKDVDQWFVLTVSAIENGKYHLFAFYDHSEDVLKEKDYLKAKNFTQDKTKTRQVNDLIHKMKRQIRVNGREHTATSHYMMNYGYVPLWILVKVLSFGIVGELFSILKYEDQKKICDIYHLNVSTMITYLPILSNYRNLCAHEDILYENRTQKVIPNTIYHKLLNIEEDDEGYVQGKNDVFALVIIMKDMLSKEEFKNMMLELEREINNLSYNLHTIKVEDILKRMGFPTNFEQIEKIERSYEEDEN